MSPVGASYYNGRLSPTVPAEPGEYGYSYVVCEIKKIGETNVMYYDSELGISGPMSDWEAVEDPGTHKFTALETEYNTFSEAMDAIGVAFNERGRKPLQPPFHP